MQTNGICTNQNLSLKIKCRKFIGTWRYKWFTQSRQQDQTWFFNWQEEKKSENKKQQKARENEKQ